ncbi:MAG: trypsin-like peptidase domain-containing protein [bacterium]|nr:trypsin-like peptidase domain-containing protein [bacterium]
MPEKNSRKLDFQPNSLKILVIAVFIFSLIGGGISGLLFGTWASTNSNVSDWIQKNIFIQSITSAEGNLSKTVSIAEESGTIDAVETVSPSVVNIIITRDLSESSDSSGSNVFPFGDLFEFNLPFNFEQPQGEQQLGAGTGFIITNNGLILTNKHVVDTQNAKFTVVLNNDEQYEATVVDTDPFNGIALIRIEATDLPVVEFGDSDSLLLGQSVIAIGNTLGQYSNTVTKGIVSGLSRTVTAGDGNGQSETLEDIIQTDAAINFGNSGGPLINIDGQVIGVNTAISVEGQLVGFAIPINQVKKAVESVIAEGKIIRPYLGVRYILLNADIAKKNNLDIDYGALIVRGSDETELAIIPGSPADKAGLVENDIILKVNDQIIDTDHSLARQLQKYNPGDSVTLVIQHDGEEKTVQAVLAEVED